MLDRRGVSVAPASENESDGRANGVSWRGDHVVGGRVLETRLLLVITGSFR